MSRQALEARVDVAASLMKHGITAGTLIEVFAMSGSVMHQKPDHTREVIILDDRPRSAGQTYVGYLHPSTYEQADIIVLASGLSPGPTMVIGDLEVRRPEEAGFPLSTDRLEIPYDAIHHINAFDSPGPLIARTAARVFVHPKALGPSS